MAESDHCLVLGNVLVGSKFPYLNILAECLKELADGSLTSVCAGERNHRWAWEHDLRIIREGSQHRCDVAAVLAAFTRDRPRAAS